MSEPRAGLPSFPKGTPIVFAATLINVLAVWAPLAVLPLYITGPLGGSKVSVGLVIGSFAFAAIVARPLAGRWGDRRGRRPVIIAGTAMTALCGVLYAVPLGVGGLVLVRVILGVGEGIVYTSGAAWVADRSPDENRGRLIGLFGLAVWIGVSVGPLTGDLVLQATDSYNAVWALCAVTPLLALALLTRMPEGDRPAHHGQHLTGLRSLVPTAAVMPGLALMTANLGYAAVSSYLVLMLEQKAIGHGALALGCFAGAVVVNRLAFGNLPDRLGGRRSAMLAAGVEAIGLLLIAVAGSLPIVLIAAAVMGTGFSMLFPSLALILLSATDPANRGAAMGAFTAFFDLGIAIGSPLVGVVATAFGYPAAFAAGAGGAVVGLLIAAATRVPSDRHPSLDEDAALEPL